MSNTTHPAFAPIAHWLEASTAPSVAMLNGWAREAGVALPDGRPIRFVAAPRARQSALEYERQITLHGEVATRPCNRHDYFNALAWLAFPLAKAALNAIHVSAESCERRTTGPTREAQGDRSNRESTLEADARHPTLHSRDKEAAPAPTANARNRARDAATLLDENGVIVACADAGWLALWREHAWRELFWTRRADIPRMMRVVAIGHGLLQKLLRPFPAITARALVIPLDPASLPDDSSASAARLDAAAAAQLKAFGPLFAPTALLRLPVAALPGWDPDRDCLGERRFDDASVFRPRSHSGFVPSFQTSEA
jgi:hypothetical protein